MGPLFIVVAAMLWAVDGVLRRSLFSLAPIIIVFYEHLVGGAIILPFSWKKISQDWAKIMVPRVLGLTAVIAVLSGLLGTLWFTSALQAVNFIPFSVVFLLQKLQPIFAIVTAAVLLKEKLHPKFLLWAGAAIVAAYFVTFPNGMVNLATGERTLMAALLAVGAAGAWGTSTVFSKMLLQEVNQTVATTLRFVATSLVALPTVFLMGASAQLTAVTTDQWVRLVVIALSTGMVALWLYYSGLKRTKAKVSTLLELTFPLLAVVIDAVQYQTYLKPMQYLAGLLLIGIMWQVARLNSAEDVTPVVATPDEA